ncbi:unnamed protein product [Rotaria sordida]|uniref:VIT domain-containing protein n=1 Tax=Rotaria sordida TaxID=392033 RepID=A0A814X878_9BILA|nr:unnamed protein product [Rotaria sordida]
MARIDDEREIVAELKEKKTAQQEYTQAIAQGHGAYLFEQDEDTNDIFVVSVGALKPGSQCRIRISYHSVNKASNLIVTSLSMLRYHKLEEIPLRPSKRVRS